MLNIRNINTEFSGIRFTTIRNIAFVNPIYPEFPGLEEANSSGTDFVLPKILKITFLDADKQEFEQSFDFYELLLLASFDENIPKHFTKLCATEESLDEDLQALFISELGLVVCRFLLSYSPSAVELYQTLKNADLSVSILWQFFNLRWVTWSKIFKTSSIAPAYVTSIILMLFRLRDITVCEPSFAESINEYAFSNKKGKAPRPSTFFSQDKIETSRKILASTFKKFEYSSEGATTCQFPLNKLSFESVKTGMSITLASGEVIELSLFEMLQFSLLIDIPEKLERPELNSPLFLDALKAIVWPFFMMHKVTKVDAIYILDCFKVGKNWLANNGIPKTTEYYRTTLDNFDKAHPGLMGTVHMLIWDAKGSSKPIFPKS